MAPRTLLPSALVVVSLGLAGCGTTVIDPSTSYALTFTQSGGLVGEHRVTTIDTSAKKVGFQEAPGTATATAPLTDDDLAHLADVVQRADLPNAGGPFHCTSCGDAFEFEAELQLDGETSDVKWEEFSDAPKGVLALGDEIAALDARKFAEH